MSEEELERFKIIHFLIYFCWNIGFGKPLLKFGLAQGINPLKIITDVTNTSNQLLRNIFNEMHRESVSEWFASEQELIRHFENPVAINDLIKHFCKLNMKYIAYLYQSKEAVQTLHFEISDRLIEMMSHDKSMIAMIEDIAHLNSSMTCADLLAPVLQCEVECSSSILQYFFHDPRSFGTQNLFAHISRPIEYVDFCHFHLSPNGCSDLSITNLVRFLEIGGMKMLRNKIELFDT